MKTMKMMANIAKGLMLAAFMAVGTTTVNAQEQSATYTPADANDWWMGEDVSKLKEAYLYNVGAQIFATNNTPSETDIKNANLWTIGSGNTFTNKETGNVLHLHSVWSLGVTWTASISNDDATSFSLENGTSTNKGFAYRLANKEGINTRYFNIDGNIYSPAKKQSTYNDWLFISQKQKDAYVEYKNSFNEVDSYLTNEKVEKEESLLAKIKEVLTTVSNVGHSFSTYAGEDGDKVKLTGILDEIKNFLNTPTGIETIKPATDNAEATAIYDVNGVRQNSLTKGINIVKMSDGTTKKIIK